MVSNLGRICVARQFVSVLRCRQNFHYQRCFASTASASQFDYKMVSLRSIPSEDLGHSILHKKEHGGEKSATDVMGFGIKCAKLCSLTGSALGVVMMPILTKYLSEAATEKPSIMVFTVISNAALGILALTPVLLHSLTRRFVLDVYYNDKTETFTTVHYNFFLQKRALRFRASDVLLSEHSDAARKMWIPLATCFVDKHPLMLILEPDQYSDMLAFHKLTANLALTGTEKSE